MTALRRRMLRDLIMYAVVAAMALAGAASVLRLWRADPGVPFGFTGDATYNCALTQGVLENGWFVSNPRLGAPGTMSLMDFPSDDHLHWAFLWLLVRSVGDWAEAYNLYYLIGFPLVAVASTCAMRRLGVSRLAAVVAGVLYALAPYHFLRGEGHIMLSSYYLVPPTLAFAVELFGPSPPLTKVGEDGRRLRLRGRGSPAVLTVCVLAGIAGVYYALWAAFFFVVAGAVAWWRTGESVRARAAAVLAAVVLASVAVGLAPFVVHRVTTPANTEVAARRPVEAFVYGLRTVDMLLPVQGHRVARLAALRAEHRAGLAGISGVLDNESQTSALGAVASTGFLLLLAVTVAGRRRRRGLSDRLEAAASLNVAGLLLASAGGFGAVVAIWFPLIRGYNRLSIHLAFLGLLALAWVFDASLPRGAGGWRRWAAPVVAGVVLLVGVFDQTTPAMVPDYEGLKARTDSLGSFVAEMEQGLAPGAAVFQLPYVRFPEHPAPGKMADYDQMQPFLFSETLRWSGAAMKGSEVARWQSVTSTLPPDAFVDAVREKGFSAVWLDRAGYDDGGLAKAEELRSVLGTEAKTSSDGRYAFFPLDR